MLGSGNTKQVNDCLPMVFPSWWGGGEDRVRETEQGDNKVRALHSMSSGGEEHAGEERVPWIPPPWMDHAVTQSQVCGAPQSA